jgi:hypothetical protein
LRLRLNTLFFTDMKLLFLFLPIAFLVSCTTDSTKKHPTNEPTYTLIFIDKSLSLNTNQAFARKKYIAAIKTLLAETVRQTGDKIEVYFLHENTTQARALLLTVRTQTDDLAGASPTDREAAQTEFDVALQRERATFARQIISKLDQQNLGLSNQRTDIWGSLSAINRANETGMAVQVLYLSDMIESMAGQPNRRDFHKTPPANQIQADAWATADAVLLGQQYAIGSPTVRVVLPFEPTASKRVNNPNIMHYWQTLFEKLGAAVVIGD